MFLHIALPIVLAFVPGAADPYFTVAALPVVEVKQDTISSPFLKKNLRKIDSVINNVDPAIVSEVVGSGEDVIPQKSTSTKSTTVEKGETSATTTKDNTKSFQKGETMADPKKPEVKKQNQATSTSSTTIEHLRPATSSPLTSLKNEATTATSVSATSSQRMPITASALEALRNFLFKENTATSGVYSSDPLNDRAVLFSGFGSAGLGFIMLALGSASRASNAAVTRGRRRRGPFIWSGIVLLVGAFIMILFVTIREAEVNKITPVFSEKTMLANLWSSYKREYLEPGTLRTMDKQRGYISTSEGEAYSMLRAVWSDDKAVFDQSYLWTKDNLRRPSDHLFSWLFGKRSNGSYGVLTEQSGENSASDADTDIALALVFAYSRWQDEKYLAAARDIIEDIWEHEVVLISGRPYMASNNLEKTIPSKTVLLNPSYFAPYAYRIFSSIDRDHNWVALVASSYEILEKSSSLALDKKKSAGLPPDWVLIDRETGALKAPVDSDLTTNFGFDAIRVPWRVGLDWQWYKDKRAKTYLAKLSFLENEWKHKHRLYAVYGHDGSVALKTESPSMYGATLGYFLTQNPEMAKVIYEDKLLNLYNPDTERWRKTLSYYDDNIAWFGMMLYNNSLGNLYSLNF